MRPGNFIEMAGRRFGRLVVLRENGRVGLQAAWLCRCDCGKETTVGGHQLRNGNTKSCGCLRFDTRNGWKGYGEISSSFWSVLEYSASKRSIPFDVTKQEAWECFLQQDRRCAYTGVVLHFVTTREQRRNGQKQTASLDRINSRAGYTVDNIQWVHKVVNIMKNSLPEDEFFIWCEMVTAKRAGIEYTGPKSSLADNCGDFRYCQSERAMSLSVAA